MLVVSRKRVKSLSKLKENKMATRGKKRNPNSEHQLIMNILFGKKEAKNQPTCWLKWPKPQRDIYSRMFSNHLTFTNNQNIKDIKNFISNIQNRI